MTNNESDRIVLKIPKSLWSSGAQRMAASPRNSELGGGVGDKKVVSFDTGIISHSEGISPRSRRGRKRKVPINSVVNMDNINEFIQSALCDVPEVYLSRPVQCSPSEHLLTAVGHLTYGDLARHMHSLRIDYVYKMLGPLIQKYYLHTRNGGNSTVLFFWRYTCT